MNLTDAITLVAADTRESTSASFTDTQAIASARGITRADLSAVDDATLRSAYSMVLEASDADVAKALR
ncbi:hypothetical protein L3Q67_45025 (plasmid) [Saccharothrix sp. AJ9571]|nr:hypothetical protein L3Q67_45025 [Saccharothrix sp. AJ9571]